MSEQAPEFRPTPPSRDPEEQAFLANYDASQFPHPSVAVDVVLLTVEDGALHAFLVRRLEHPARGRWALPGGFVGIHESLDDAVERVLRSKAGLSDVFVEQLFTFGAPDRDPRTRVISIAYFALVDSARLRSAQALGDDARLAVLNIPPTRATIDGEASNSAAPAIEARDLENNGVELPLAFDHGAILGVAWQRLRGKLDYTPIGFELLPPRFTLRQLQTVHETVLGRAVNKDSFRRRMLASGRVAPTGEREQGVLHRPAELYRFTKGSSGA